MYKRQNKATNKSNEYQQLPFLVRTFWKINDTISTEQLTEGRIDEMKDN